MPTAAAQPSVVDTPAQEAWSLLQELMLEQRGRFLSIATTFELSPPQMMALRALKPGQPVAMSDLAGKLRCDNSNVTGIVDRLEERGLVVRRPADHDRRVKHLVVTPTGEALRDEVEAAFSTPLTPIGALDEADQLALRDILRRALGRD